MATMWAAIEDIVPFPALTNLAADGGYPFSDDLLFRGNGASLKNLGLLFSAIAWNKLGRLKFGTNVPGDLVFQSLCTAPDTAVLQRLEFGQQWCSADDIIKLLAALPSLVHLSCDIRKLQAEILAIPVSGRPSRLREKYYPLSNNFRTLSVA
ncbi:hypothetical protein IWW57_004634 [Coemansia sp. S610]|nr:hypothetical protein IWW57_004634 [Coemansia sp. S610]